MSVKKFVQSERDRWFAEELQPYELMLRGWLKRQFPLVCDLDDIVQETFLRVLQAYEKSAVRSPKAFLFATARNLVLDRERDRKVERVDPLAEIDAESVMDDEAGTPEKICHSQDLELLTKAVQSLPKRCRQILTLRKLHRLSQRDVAAQLGISEHTVEVQGTIGLRKIREFFKRAGRRSRFGL